MRAPEWTKADQIDYSAVVTFDGLTGLISRLSAASETKLQAMSYDQLCKWFSATPGDFVMDALRQGRRGNGCSWSTT